MSRYFIRRPSFLDEPFDIAIDYHRHFLYTLQIQIENRTLKENLADFIECNEEDVKERYGSATTRTVRNAYIRKREAEDENEKSQNNE